MHSEAQELIRQYGLVEHPEGGWYKEVYRSDSTVNNRNLLTSIYFLLTSENPSNFHRIKSDELWYFHRGSGLTVHTLDKNGHSTIRISNEAADQPFALVQAETIFGSSIEEENGFALVSCAVAPGFDFRDFELLDRTTLMNVFPEEKAIIEKLTRA